MMVELPRIIVPFLIAFFQVILTALALGLVPALWVFRRGRHSGLLLRWGIVTGLCLAAAFYLLPLAKISWRTWVTEAGFKPVSLWLGYLAGGLFAPMLLPEPLRQAKLRVRHERRPQKW